MSFSFSREGRYSRLAPRATNRPQTRWELHCHLRPGPGQVLGDILFLYASRRNADNLRDYYADHNIFRSISFETLGRSITGAMQFINELVHAAFP
jgi:hypothetical protein